LEQQMLHDQLPKSYSYSLDFCRPTKYGTILALC
jgi:hypothetical protein